MLTPKTAGGPATGKLKKVLGLAFGLAIVVGGTIGVGILRAPASIAAVLPSPGLILLCWVLIGLYILLTASSYAELTTMMPKAGGAYNYIQRAFGPYAGFINGWFDFVSNAIAPAYFCIVIGEYCSLLFPVLKPFSSAVSIGFLTLFTAINLPGVKSGSLTQQLTSAIKILLFLVLIAGCFLSPHTHAEGLVRPLAKGSLLLGAVRALQLINGAYDGWMSVSFFAEEDKDPGKNIPKSYLIGALTVMVLYLLINAAILWVLPIDFIAGAPLVASDAASVAFGKWSSDFVVIIAVFSLISILNAYIMIPPRILFGMGRDGFFLRSGAKVNKGGTPYVSLLLCYALSFILILVSSFEQLFGLGVFFMDMVFIFAFLSLIRLRKKEPDLPRPYKAWGYPYTTYFALVASIVLFVVFAIGDRVSLVIFLGANAVLWGMYHGVVKKGLSRVGA